jgi:hypothetical protein
VGFQVWQPDARLFNAFFNFAGSTTLTGNRNAYGSALLNPSIEGLSFTSTYNRVLESLGQKHSPLVSVFGELAVAFTTWQPDTTKPGVSGFIVVFTPGLEFSTKTLRGEEPNTYQAGIDLGPTFRVLGGNLAQGSASTFRSDTTVLGDSKTFFTGLAVTGWIRLNSVQPFIRVTRFGGTEIPGFSGLQAFMGVKALSPIFRTATN